MKVHSTGDDMSKKALIFDMYGTLVSTGNGSVMATKKILDHVGASVDPDTFYKEWKQTLQYMTNSMESFITQKELFSRSLDVMFCKYSIIAKSKDSIHYMLESLENRKAFTDASPAINDLRKKYNIIIGSTSDTLPLLHDIKNNNICVDSVFTSESMRVYKPKRGFYLGILAATGFSVNDTIFIGDSIVDDIKGPQSIGMSTILIDRQNRYNRSCGIVPNVIIRELTELLSDEIGIILNNT